MSASNVKPVIAPSQAASTSSLLGNLSITAEKNKQWQRELLMERIRSHSTQHKTFQELSKNMRMGMLEKRYPLDAVEKSNLQKCLDNMQHCIKVTSRQGLVERLESLSRQLSLKFSDDGKALFISTDMFFLEIVLDANGCLSDVKIHHESKADQQSCSELVECLNNGDFADFTAQLEGFSSIYQLNADSKVKIKAYDAMLGMEADLYNVFQMQNFTKDTQQILQDSIVGVVLQRRGGHPMRLVYFVSPYDLISLESKTLQPLSLETFSKRNVGFSVTVNLEASSACKLPVMPTVTVAKDPQTGADVPVFAPLNQMNSMLLPATFILRLNRPLPVCYTTLRSMGLCSAATNETNNPLPSALEAQHKTPLITNIMNLIVQTASDQQMKSAQKGLFVCLPDQTHCYFFTENKLLKSTLIHSVPFTEPSQVPKILGFLKKMALFYSLLASCVRPQSKMGNDIDSTTILEVNAISFQQISVALQHPYEESMATLEFDLRSGMPQCTIYSISNNYDLLSIKLTSVVQKCLSIPVTIRALLRFWDQERLKMFQRSIGGGTTNTGGIGGCGGAGGGGGGVSGGGGANLGGVGGGSGVNMSNTSHTAYGNFNMTGGSNDPGGGGGMGLNANMTMVGGMKLDSAGQQRSQLQTSVPGFLKYKSGELKQEDFHESPKSQTLAAAATEHIASSLMQSNMEVNSLGGQTLTQQQQQQQQHQLHLQSQTAQGYEQKIAADHEIADKYKNIWKDKTPNLKNSVSITPINEASNNHTTTSNSSNSSSSNSSSATLDVKRTGGIEIIPLTGPNNNNNGTNPNVTSSTITITPINAGSSPSYLPNKEKKSANVGAATAPVLSTSSSSNKRPLDTQGDAQKDKKRKKRRDDSPMGPPEKVYSRQNSPAGCSEAGATAVARKFSSPSSSPKGCSGGLLASSVSGSSLSASARPSPKHSPVYSSPKHNTASNSPKSPFGTQSPKHGSSGKPSMSTLKSAAAASPKGDKTSSTSNATSTASVLNTAALVRSLQSGVSSSSAAANTVAAAAAAAMAALKNKDKSTAALNSAAVSSAAAAAAAVKSSMGVNSMQQQQQLKSSVTSLNHMTAAAAAGFASSNNPNSNLDLNTAMRKSVAAAVSLMMSTPTTATVSTTASTRSPQRQSQESPAKHKHQSPLTQQQPGNHETQKVSASSLSTSTDTSNTGSGSGGGGGVCSNSSSEYMVKSSQEGLKLTINKTSHKSSTKSTPTKSSQGSSSSSSSSSTSFNKKLHTGLKPGVNSGPASKKTTSSSSSSSSLSSSSSSLTSSPSSKSSAIKHIFQKSNSSGSLSTKLGSNNNNSSLSSSLTGYGLSKSHSTNSVSDARRSSKKSHSASTSPALSSPHNFFTGASTSSQSATRLDHQADMMKILQYASPIMAASMEGFMKGLNSKFQIPKLSQRNNNSNAANSNTSNANTSSATSAATVSAATVSNANTSSYSSSSSSSSSVAQNHTAPQQPPAQPTLAVNVLKTSSPSKSITSSSATESPAPKSKSPTAPTTAVSASLDILNTAPTTTSLNSSHDDDTHLATLETTNK